MDLEAGEAIEVGRSHIIKRPRLTRLLDETDARIILLVAPAGYGKTTLAREWLEGKPHAWYRGSTASADVAALALGLARAASRVVPGAADHLAKRLRVINAPVESAESLAELVADGISNWPRSAWLVFDDYQFACDSDAAETFVENLLSDAPINLLVASRCNPRWASPRRLIYGELCEIVHSNFCMSSEEAECVLADRSSREARGLATLANGWPALIGLAALPNDIALPQSSLPDDLYRYFAEELYEALSPPMQEALRKLSLTPVVTFETAALLLRADASPVIREALRLGFFSAWTHDRWEFHPLLRSFLASKFRETNDDPDGRIVATLVATHVEHGDWDRGFDLVERFFDTKLLETLFESALTSMLNEARVPTLAHWVNFASERKLTTPVTDLAEAEIFFKGGDFQRAEAFALQAARCFPSKHPLKTKAYWLAGVSAHVSSRSESALDHYRLAMTWARNDADLRQAVWGRYSATVSLDHLDAAEGLLDDLERRSGSTADELLRLATGRLMLSSLRGDALGILDEVAVVAPLTARSEDPLVHSSFLNVHSAVLALGGRYSEALAAASAELEVISTFGLGFARPDAQLHQALALYGLRSLRRSVTALNAAEREAAPAGHEYLLMNVGVLRARLDLLTDPLDALTVFERYESVLDRPAMQGEYCAWRSLAFAAAGRNRDAEEMACRAESLSQRIEVRALTPWTRCVVAANQGLPLAERTGHAFQNALRSGNIDAFVATYRAVPTVLSSLAANPANTHHLKEILGRASDHLLAEAVGLRLPRLPESHGLAVLTSREREVLMHVTEGLTNKQIGRALFIEEVTVKAHMRKICRKLGVRTRTEAAIRATEFSD